MDVGHADCRTIYVPGHLRGAYRAAPSARDSFLAAYRHMARLAARADDSSVVVAAVDVNGLTADSAIVPSRRALIIGRHSRCSILLGDGTISLRHVALLVRPPDGGAPVVHLWDLHTPQPMRTEDGRACGALVVDGATCVTLGRYALWIVPAAGVDGRGWPASARRAFAARPPVEHRGSRRPEPHLRSSIGRRVPRHPERRDGGDSWPGRTLVTAAPAPIFLDGSRGGGSRFGTVRVRHGGDVERFVVTKSRVDRGVLIGRYQRCHVATDGLDDDRVSRVHLLLARIAGEVWAIDTASRNGVWLGDRRVHAEVLDDACTLGLGTATRLDWSTRT